MSTCVSYAPTEFPLARRERRTPALLLNHLGRATGVSDASLSLALQTANLGWSYLIVLSFPLPLEVEFSQKTVEWKRATQFCSSPEIATAHPAYKRIIGMGPEVVPLIIRSLEREPALWFDALTALTGEQPVPEEHAGDIEAMCADWIAWARRNGIK